MTREYDRLMDDLLTLTDTQFRHRYSCGKHEMLASVTPPEAKPAPKPQQMFDLSLTAAEFSFIVGCFKITQHLSLNPDCINASGTGVSVMLLIGRSLEGMANDPAINPVPSLAEKLEKHRAAAILDIITNHPPQVP